MNIETKEYLKTRQAGQKRKKDASESRENISSESLLLDASGAAMACHRRKNGLRL